MDPHFVRREPGGSYSIWHAGIWYPVNDNNMLDIASPDARVHACFHSWGDGSVHMLCVILPWSD